MTRRGLLALLALALFTAGCNPAPGDQHPPASPPTAIAIASAIASAAASAPTAGAIPAPPPRPQLDGRAFPDKVLALTWDDGPDVNTLALARDLHRWHVSATFFVVDAWIDGVSAEPGRGEGVFQTGAAHIPILGELVALGHRLGNHTKNHVLLSDAAPDVVRAQLREHQATLDRWSSNDLRLFRAPGGAWSAAASAAVDADPALRSLIGPVRWDIDGKDWEASLYCRSDRPALECERYSAEVPSRVKHGVTAMRYLAAIEARGHGIVLLHDRVGHVGSGYARSIANILVPELIKRGYVFAAPVLRFSSPSPRPGFKLPAREGALRGDLNGDGRADMCTWSKEGLSCALATASGFTSATPWLPELDEAHGWTAREAESLALVDVNGDGRADVCGRGPGGVVCATAP